MRIVAAFVVMLYCVASFCHAQLTEQEMMAKLKEYNEKALGLCNKLNKAEWNVATDIENQEKEEELEKVWLEYAKFEHDQWEQTWRDSKIESYESEDVRRSLMFLKNLGTSALPPADLSKLSRVISKMSGTYAGATVCKYGEKPNGQCTKYTLDPEISDRMAKSRDYDELEYYWKGWHDNSGKKMREDYKSYVQLMNQAARANNFHDASAWWQSDFETEDFGQFIDDLWAQVQPLYNDLHTYTKYKLLEIYGDKIDRKNPNIPAHLLGNMWAQSWNNLYDDIKPFKNASLVDVTAQLKAHNYTAKKMFETSNEFYMSLGLPSNEASYTGESIITKPENRTIQCHASAWDFCDGTDFRIKMCTNIDMEDFIVIHHEMGHIQYYIQYRDLPLTLRDGANPAFHEAVGDTMALSVTTPQHLIKLGLLENYKDTVEDNINALLSQALQRVGFLPFGVLIDKWRWDVFSGAVPESRWNAHWWDLRNRYQKVSAPVPRSENDFDPGAKYHIPGSSAYISYFLAHLLEFQFYKALCIEAKEYNPADPKSQPLHKCDFYKSKEAGTKLANALEMGKRKHWSVALKALTGQETVSASALLEYFQPLQEFLKQEIKNLEKEDQMRQTLSKHNVLASIECNKLVTAEWNVATDIENGAKHKLLEEAVNANAKFVQEQYRLNFEGQDPNAYDDEKIKRQLTSLTKLGLSALSESRLTERTKAISRMEKLYNTAVFCPHNKPNCQKSEMVTLDPEITQIMAESTDFDELKYTWEQWHNKSGALMRDDYKKYVDISNEAAKLNNYSDYGEMWRSDYEDGHFVHNMLNLWKRIEPLYDELHKYMRIKLLEIYGNKMNTSDPLIPAHLLGNMWAQTWQNLYHRTKPFKNVVDVDVTKALKANNFTVLKMFEESDRFYQNLGLAPMKMSYTPPSVIEKPTDRVIVCHASAEDFCDGRDFRIKQCTTVDQEYFETIHHEMGHIQYFIQYKDQPITFRDGANPGFHEAIGDLMALSVMTPKHLKKINLLPKDYVSTEETTINALFSTALQRLAFLPFGLTIDLYRWDIFSGKVPETQWNSHWEKLREQYQRIRSPVPRSEKHFDAGAKFHVPADSQYINYFVSHILEFQLYRGMCKAAGEYVSGDPKLPLHNCDFEGSKAVGDKLKAGLSIGFSKHWKEALKELTGEDDLSADAIVEYFKPLHEFLKKHNDNVQKIEVAEATGWSGWVYAGIAVGSLCAIGLIAYGIYYCNKK